MSTFFEKLTGSSAAPAQARVTASSSVSASASEPETETKKGRGRPPKNPIRETQEEIVLKSDPSAAKPYSAETKSSLAGAKHLKVASEETSPSKEEEPLEEEGELTVDIYDRGDAIVIQSTVAGVKPEDLDISVTSDTVTIRGKRIQPEKIDEQNYYYKELFWGAFARSIILPEEIAEEEVEALLKNGLLTLTLPKKKRGVVQKVKVKIT